MTTRILIPPSDPKLIKIFSNFTIFFSFPVHIYIFPESGGEKVVSESFSTFHLILWMKKRYWERGDKKSARRVFVRHDCTTNTSGHEMRLHSWQNYKVINYLYEPPSELY